MLRSITATSSWRSPVLVVKQASEITSVALLSETMHCVEGHISHSSWILRRCHPEESLCSCEFNRGSFLKHAPFKLKSCLFSTCHVKKLECCYELQFGRISLNISLLDSVFETKKLQAKEINSTWRTLSVCKLLQIVNFDGLTFLTALVSFNQSDYLKHFNKDSDCLSVACFIRVWNMLTTLLFALGINFFLKNRK